jgi:hypothetical protein
MIYFARIECQDDKLGPARLRSNKPPPRVLPRRIDNCYTWDDSVIMPPAKDLPGCIALVKGPGTIIWCCKKRSRSFRVVRRDFLKREATTMRV